MKLSEEERSLLKLINQKSPDIDQLKEIISEGKVNTNSTDETGVPFLNVAIANNVCFVC